MHASECLFCMVDNNIYIKGISLNNINFKMTQFADDTTLFLDGSKAGFSSCSIKHVRNIWIIIRAKSKY